MRQFKIPAKVRAGDAIRAQAWNEMVDALHALQAECARLRVRGGAGIAVEESVGGTLVKLSRRGAPAVAEEGSEYLFPFKVSARIVRDAEGKATVCKVTAAPGVVVSYTHAVGTAFCYGGIGGSRKPVEYTVNESGSYALALKATYQKLNEDRESYQRPSDTVGWTEIDFLREELTQKIIEYYNQAMSACDRARPYYPTIEDIVFDKVENLRAWKNASSSNPDETNNLFVFATVEVDLEAGTAKALQHWKSDLTLTLNGAHSGAI